MIDIVDRLSFDATRCEVSFSKGVASNIEEGIAEIKRLRDYIWSLDGKTICTRTDGDTFIDEGFIRASDIVPLDHQQSTRET